MTRTLYFIAGMLSLGLGIIGAVLPLLPTTVFVILAAFCFSRSSKRFHQMLLNNKLFGPMIAQWEAHGVIPLKAKCLASTMMLVMVSYPLFFKQLPIWAVIGVIATVVIALSYIWSRPSAPLTSS